MTERSRRRALYGLAVAALVAVAGTPLFAQTTAAPKIAVIDSDRIVEESTRGKAALEKLKGVQEQKLAEGRAKQQQITDLRKRIEEGQMSLAPDKLAELRKQYEDAVIALRRFTDDADREMGKLRDEALSQIEADVMSIINEIGAEGGYTLIFNKFRSGLVYAQESVDITDEVIRRFNAKPAG